MFEVLRRMFGDHVETDQADGKESVQLDGLTLYYTPTCPFCTKVQWMLLKHGLSIEKKNLLVNADAHDELVKGGGRQTVPCLRIERNGENRWLYESDDIIAYLKKEAQVA